jgi:hypothetical protein
MYKVSYIQGIVYLPIVFLPHRGCRELMYHHYTLSYVSSRLLMSCGNYAHSDERPMYVRRTLGRVALGRVKYMYLARVQGLPL